MKLFLNFWKKLEKRRKVILILIFVFLIFDITIFSIRFLGKKYSSVEFFVDDYSSGRGKVLELRYKNNYAGYTYYKFTALQQKDIENYYKSNEPVSIKIRIGVKNLKDKYYETAFETEKPFYYGLIKKENFSTDGKFLGNSQKTSLAGTDLRNFIKDDFGETYFDLSYALEKNLSYENLPCGFFIYTSHPLKVYSATICRAAAGFDFSKDIPFYGFASNGGSFLSRPVSFDFSGCQEVFSVQNSKYTVMPKIEVAFLPSEDYGTTKEQVKIKLNAGGEVLTIRRNKRIDKVTLQASLLGSPFSFFQISENENLVTTLIMTSNDENLIPKEASKVLVPFKTDPGLILGTRMNNWRFADYELYEWEQFPGILFFDTKDYKIQNDFFKRLAFFSEKVGYRNKILSDEQLNGLHGYNAHDYGSQSLADFFTLSENEGIELNQKEYLLKEILLKNGLIYKKDSGMQGYRAGKGAVVSISQESQEWLRYVFTAHEAWHGIFFTDEDFRTAASAVYYTIDPKSLEFLLGFWQSQASLGYDPSDLFLMKNEFTAYIMQQPLNLVAKYFVNLTNRASVMNAIPSLCSYIRSINGSSFEDAGRILEAYAFDNWGLACGRVWLVNRN